jgi:hypothetical protein
LREAARTVRQSDENDTLTITKVKEGQVTVRSARSLAASKNAKLDHQLSFSEFMYAKNLFLTAIDNAKWGDDATNAFNWFFQTGQSLHAGGRGARRKSAIALRVQSAYGLAR